MCIDVKTGTVRVSLNKAETRQLWVSDSLHGQRRKGWSVVHKNTKTAIV